MPVDVDILRLVLAVVLGLVGGSVTTLYSSIRPMARKIEENRAEVNDRIAELRVDVARVEEKVTAMRPTVIIVPEERRRQSRERVIEND